MKGDNEGRTHKSGKRKPGMDWGGEGKTESDIRSERSGKLQEQKTRKGKAGYYIKQKREA